MKRLLPFLLLSVLVPGCGSTGPLALLWARFRIEDTQDFHLCGIPIGDLENLDPLQTAQVLGYWLQGECPVDFRLGVGVRNPNISSQWILGLPLTLVRMDYDLYMDTDDDPALSRVKVATGVFTGELGLPETGEVAVLGLDISFDAFHLLQVLGPEAVIDLMLAVGGISGNIRSSEHLGRLSLFAVPEVEYPGGSMIWEEGFYIGLDWTSGSKP